MRCIHLVEHDDFTDDVMAFHLFSIDFSIFLLLLNINVKTGLIYFIFFIIFFLNDQKTILEYWTNKRPLFLFVFRYYYEGPPLIMTMIISDLFFYVSNNYTKDYKIHMYYINASSHPCLLIRKN